MYMIAGRVSYFVPEKPGQDPSYSLLCSDWSIVNHQSDPESHRGGVHPSLAVGISIEKVLVGCSG